MNQLCGHSIWSTAFTNWCLFQLTVHFPWMISMTLEGFMGWYAGSCRKSNGGTFAEMSVKWWLIALAMAWLSVISTPGTLITLSGDELLVCNFNKFKPCTWVLVFQSLDPILVVIYFCFLDFSYDFVLQTGPLGTAATESSLSALDQFFYPLVWSKVCPCSGPLLLLMGRRTQWQNWGHCRSQVSKIGDYSFLCRILPWIWEELDRCKWLGFGPMRHSSRIVVRSLKLTLGWSLMVKCL